MRIPADRQELIALITLLSAGGIGNRRAAELVKLFGSGEAALAAPAGEISAALNVPLEVGRAVTKAGKDRAKAAALLDKAEAHGARILTTFDGDYPARLRTIGDPPVMLYAKGPSSPLYDYAVAVVGTRTPSDHAARIAFRIGADLAAAGVTVTSGMAMGIDSEAHSGALSAGGRTIAVLGTGIDRVYPPTNVKLFNRICEQGMILTEYPPGTGPAPHNFPARNRIVSGISLGVVIVEAGWKSGALITAREAAEQGREVFAVPGPAGLPRSLGVNRLIKEGAGQMVESAADILGALKNQLAPVMNVAATLALPKLPQDEAVIYKLLESNSLLIDEIIQKSKFGAVEVNRLITSMQLKGLIRRLPGARISRA